MSDADPDERSVSANGFSVRKSLNTDQFRTPAIVFDVRSERPDPARIQLRDAIPGEIAMEDIGFHPDYGGDHWTVEDREVVFERDFDPEEEYTTIYGVRDIDEEEARDLLTDPTVEVIDGGTEEGIEGIDDIVSEEDSQVVRDVISGEREGLPGLGEEEPPTAESAASEGGDELPDDLLPDVDLDETPAEPAEAEAGTGAASDPSPLEEEAPPDEGEPAPLDEEGPSPLEDEPAEADDAEASTPEAEEAGAAPEPESQPEPEVDSGFPSGSEPEPEADDEVEEAAGVAAEADVTTDEGRTTVPATGGVARVLAKELREGKVSEEDRRELRDALAFEEGSTEARIRHLQNQVSDLAAYTDALEAFLDESGGGRELLDDVEEEIEDVRRDVADLREEVGSFGSDVSRVEDRIETTAETVDDLETAFADVEEEVEDAREARERIDEVADRLDEIEDELDRFDDLEAEFDRLDDLEAEFDRLDDLEAEFDRLDDLEDEIATLRSDLEEMAEFRERLSAALGAAGGDPGGGGDDGSGNESEDEE